MDTQTGLTIHSLYGDHRQPLPEQLEGLDALVFDIQDIGSRYYTYISTMGLAMEAAAEAGIAFVVLDRINPIGGVEVEGPVLMGEEDFVGFHPIPIRHGMTVGELALLFQKEKEPGSGFTDCSVRHWSGGCLRNHRTTLDFSFTEHAQCEGSVSVSGNRDSGNDQFVSGTSRDTPLNYWGPPTSMILCSSQRSTDCVCQGWRFHRLPSLPMPACSRNNAARVSIFPSPIDR